MARRQRDRDTRLAIPADQRACIQSPPVLPQQNLAQPQARGLRDLGEAGKIRALPSPRLETAIGARIALPTI